MIRMLLILTMLIAAVTPAVATAQDEFVPLREVPGVIQTGQEENLPEFFNNVFRIGVGIAAILAVIMIMIGGFQYMTAEAVGTKTDGKVRITKAVLGIAIILLSYLILYIINPEIVTFRFFS